VGRPDGLSWSDKISTVQVRATQKLRSVKYNVDRLDDVTAKLKSEKEF
jgi:hypothetical protein